MKFDKKTVLIKVHYFMFSGGMAPISPFLYVLGIQLGATVAVMGTLDSLILVMSTVMEPVVAMIVDAFPKLRRPFLIAMTAVTCVSLTFMSLTPNFKESPQFASAWITHNASNETFWSFKSDLNFDSTNTTQKFYYDQANTSFSQTCRGGEKQFNTSEEVSLPWSQLQIVLPLNRTCELQSGRDCRYANDDPLLQLKLQNSSLRLGHATYSVSATDGERVSCDDIANPGSLECVGGKWDNSDCGGYLFHSGAFWYLVTIMIVREMAYATTNSFSDAITVETVGLDGNFGSQRFWQILNRLMLVPVASALVDWYSGDAATKNYTPAFILASIFAALDVVVCSFLTVPLPTKRASVWAETKLLMSKYQFVGFLFFTLMTGVLNAVPMVFLFVFQEQLAAGTAVSKHLKLLQGLTVFVRSASELPCSYYADRLVRKFGAGRLQTAIFGLHIVRLLLLAAVGTWGSIWLTLAVEVLAGPVYGLGYSLIVLYAREFTPPGLTNTVQCLANNAYDNLCFSVGGAIGGQMIGSLGAIKTFVIFAGVGLVMVVLHPIFHYFSKPLNVEDGVHSDDAGLQVARTSTGDASKHEA